MKYLIISIFSILSCLVVYGQSEGVKNHTHIIDELIDTSSFVQLDRNVYVYRTKEDYLNQNKEFYGSLEKCHGNKLIVTKDGVKRHLFYRSFFGFEINEIMFWISETHTIPVTFIGSAGKEFYYTGFPAIEGILNNSMSYVQYTEPGIGRTFFYSDEKNDLIYEIRKMKEEASNDPQYSWLDRGFNNKVGRQYLMFSPFDVCFMSKFGRVLPK